MLTRCPACQIGHLQAARTPYVRVYEGTLVNVPDVLSWRCDVCGTAFYDSDTVRRLEVLIGEAGPPPNRFLPHPPASDEAPKAPDEPPEDTYPRRDNPPRA